MSELYFAAKRLDITPSTPLRLAGFANREGNYQAIVSSIEAQLFYLKQDSRQVLLIGADLLWWGKALCETIATRLKEDSGIPKEAIIFTSTHNHSGPGTSNDFLPLLETYEPTYYKHLTDSLVEAATALAKRSEPGKISLRQGDIEMNVFRRKIVDGVVTAAPNFAVEIDHKATVLEFCSDDDRVLAHLIHYPCHANVAAENVLHGDYPAAAREILQTKYPESVTMFVQGATGDVRPTVIIGDQFAKLGVREARMYGEQFADRVLTILAKDPRPLTPSLVVMQIIQELPLDPKQDRESLAAFDQRDVWADKVLEWRPYDKRLLDLRLLRLSADCCLLTLNAEVVQEYAAYATKLDSGCLTCGYSNGMIGYLCTAEEIQEGGYEPDESTYWFALPGPYSPSIENIIKNSIQEILQEQA